jgi:hypothetical protein
MVFDLVPYQRPKTTRDAFTQTWGTYKRLPPKRKQTRALLFPIFLIALLGNSILLAILRAPRRAACRTAYEIVARITVCHTLFVIRPTWLRGLESVVFRGSRFRFEGFCRGGEVGGGLVGEGFAGLGG